MPGFLPGDRVRVKEDIEAVPNFQGKEGMVGAGVIAFPGLWEHTWLAVRLDGEDHPQLMKEDWLQPV